MCFYSHSSSSTDVGAPRPAAAGAGGGEGGRAIQLETVGTGGSVGAGGSRGGGGWSRAVESMGRAIAGRASSARFLFFPLYVRIFF